MSSDTSTKNPDLGSIYVKVGSIQLGPGTMPLCIRLSSSSEIEERMLHVRDNLQELNGAILGEGPYETLTVIDNTGLTHEIKSPVTDGQVCALCDTLSGRLKHSVLVIPTSPSRMQEVLNEQR